MTVADSTWMSGTGNTDYAAKRELHFIVNIYFKYARRGQTPFFSISNHYSSLNKWICFCCKDFFFWYPFDRCIYHTCAIHLIEFIPYNHFTMLFWNILQWYFSLKKMLLYIIQIWHPCGVYSRNESPKRRLSHKGDTPLKRDLFLLCTPKGCHICFINPKKIQNTKGSKIDKQQWFWI